MPTYAVKKTLRKNITSLETKEMKREAKYYNMLNQPAYYFLKNNKPRLMTGWLQGKTVHQFSASELKTIPIENRLQWLACGLSDLNKLHSHFRVHGDVSENNFMVNPQDNTMRLFDFGTAHKMGSSTGALTNTVLYSDPSEGASDFLKDVYAVGVLCAKLFPELYSVTSAADGKAKVEVIKDNLLPADKAIVNLVDSLTSLDRNKRPTSEDALNFCKQILEFKDNLGDLTEKKVKEISDSTINRTNFTSEDVFRGRIL